MKYLGIIPGSLLIILISLECHRINSRLILSKQEEEEIKNKNKKKYFFIRIIIYIILPIGKCCLYLRINGHFIGTILNIFLDKKTCFYICFSFCLLLIPILLNNNQKKIEHKNFLYKFINTLLFAICLISNLIYIKKYEYHYIKKKLNLYTEISGNYFEIIKTLFITFFIFIDKKYNFNDDKNKRNKKFKSIGYYVSVFKGILIGFTFMLNFDDLFSSPEYVLSIKFSLYSSQSTFMKIIFLLLIITFIISSCYNVIQIVNEIKESVFILLNSKDLNEESEEKDEKELNEFNSSCCETENFNQIVIGKPDENEEKKIRDQKKAKLCLFFLFAPIILFISIFSKTIENVYFAFGVISLACLEIAFPLIMYNLKK